MATFTTLLARELKGVSFNAVKCEVEGSVIYNVRDQNRRLGESLMSNAVWDGAGGARWCHAPGRPWTITRDTLPSQNSEDTNTKILRVISEWWPSVWLWWYIRGCRWWAASADGSWGGSLAQYWPGVACELHSHRSTHVGWTRQSTRGCLMKSQTRCKRFLLIFLC